jgi:hypothetical protein
MFNKLQGQPNSYDKKFVNPIPGFEDGSNVGADPNTNSGGHWAPVPMELYARLNVVGRNTQ